MRNIITILLLLVSSSAFGQGVVNFGASRPQDTGQTKGQIKAPVYSDNDTTTLIGVKPNGVFVLRKNFATKAYTDSLFDGITGGGVTLPQLTDSMLDIRWYIDSNNTIIYGAISAIYDTLAYYVDSATLNDSLVAIGARYVPYVGATGNVDIGTHTFTAKDGVFNHSSGSGTTLSVTKGGAGEALTVNKTSGSGNAMSVTGGVTQLSELHTTTPIADAYIASAATWNAKMNYSDTAGLSNRIDLKLNITDTTNIRFRPIAGTNMTITGTYPNLTFDATGGGGGGGSPTSATNRQVLYKGGGDTLRGATRVNIDSTDGRLVLVNNLDTSAVLSFSGGGTKIAGSNTFGTIRVVDTSSLRAELQRAVNVVAISQVLAFNVLNFTNRLSISGQTPTPLGTQSTAYADYNSTIQHLNYGKVNLTTTAAANQNAGLRYPTTSGATGIITGNTSFSGGGGRGTFMFALPAYNSGHRLIVGYSRVTTTLTGDPTAFMETLSPRVPLIGIGKDAADTTLHWMFRNSELVSSVTKVDIGVVPNADDMYIVTIYVSPSSNYILKLEVMSKTGVSTHIYQPTTNTPPVGTKLIPFFQSNSGLGSVATVLGVIQVTEEIY